MTAFMTSPFFTLAFGIASFTETTMMSPSDAYLRRVPPSTLMHSTLRAPELSATSNTVSDCTMSVHTGPTRRRASSHCLFENRAHGPALVAAERARFRDEHAVPDAAAILFIVRFHFAASAQVFLVFRVLHHALDHDDDGLVHPVADDHPFAGLGFASGRFH